MISALWTLSAGRFPAVLLLILSVASGVTRGADAKPDVAAIAARLLDDQLSQAEREQIVTEHPEHALDLLKSLTDGLQPGIEEYQRIPWIWRIAIEAAKRDEGTQVRDILFLALPGHGQPLRDWQAVVIGGGIINGLSQKQVWPRERITELLIDDEAMFARWTGLFFQAQRMAENDVVPAGTRYDALRILGCGEWEPHGVFLLKYLAGDADEELQMGAVSALVDIDSPYSTKALSDALLHLKGKNRRLAIAGLLRNSGRADALLFSIDAERVSSMELEPMQVKQLREHADPAVRKRAAKVLKDAE